MGEVGGGSCACWRRPAEVGLSLLLLLLLLSCTPLTREAPHTDIPREWLIIITEGINNKSSQAGFPDLKPVAVTCRGKEAV